MMIKLNLNLKRQGCAEGYYTVKAKGFILAVLNWGNEHGILEDWGAFAYVHLDPAGNGSFYFSGSRGIPRGATHVYAHCISSDFSHHEDTAVNIPAKFLRDSYISDSKNAQKFSVLTDLHYEDTAVNIPAKFLRDSYISDSKNAQKFSVLTDLHLSSKPWRIKRALSAAKSENIILLGDSTNDGLPEQFEEFKECIEETVPDKIFLPVIGNHDVLHASRDDDSDGCRNYAEFQKYLLSKAEDKGYTFSYNPDSPAYSVQFGDIDITGIQCVISGRKFSFPEGRQILWLENQLRENQNSRRHLILCHAPLLAHNPNRNTGNPYLAKDKMLQKIIDDCGNIIFLSGHTHVSPNIMTGNAEFDETHGNIYLDCGSVVDTDISGEKGLMSSDWNEGCITELSVTDHETEICISSIKTGIKFPRGYYYFRNHYS